LELSETIYWLRRRWRSLTPTELICLAQYDSIGCDERAIV
jgi:hypothetical protein